jgi:pimeloyl-ACP methyl ester carboxylesterase|tara:strand:- start:4124 stop:4858 length:735 start_codon:yes stop_codon:yes gene_type:complete
MNNKKTYIEKGKGEPILLLHGLFGALSNWKSTLTFLSKNYRVIIPLIPITEVNIKMANISGLTKYIEDFVKKLNLKKFSIIGNSLGGHIGLMYTLLNQEKVTKLVLTGSSGLYENSFGNSYPKRDDYEWINNRVNYTFYDSKIISKKYIDQIFKTLNNNLKCLNIITVARSAQRENLSNRLKEIKCSTLLIWGLNDTVTPPYVAHQFNNLIKNSELQFIDKCCHAPMMEHPKSFNKIIGPFLKA